MEGVPEHANGANFVLPSSGASFRGQLSRVKLGESWSHAEIAGTFLVRDTIGQRRSDRSAQTFG
jgi:hypothetical protein